MVDKAKVAAKFAQEEAQGYRLTILGRHMLVTEAMKNYATEKLAKLDRFHTHVMDIHVTMDVQNLEHVVDIVVKFEHFRIKVHAGSSDMYASIDKAVARLQKLMGRWKDRIQDHTAKKLSSIDMHVNVVNRPYNELEEFNAEIEAENAKKDEFKPPRVVGNKTVPLKTLTMDEAVMKMELSGYSFLIFRGEEDQKLKVIYRRDDDTYGIIQAE